MTMRDLGTRPNGIILGIGAKIEKKKTESINGWGWSSEILDSV
jgi:hypothetical protein